MKKNIFLIFLIYSSLILKCYSTEISQKEINILKNLRCLVCQGQSIADSNSDFAQTIKLVVQDKLNVGMVEEDIYNFLASKYGDWIVYKPRLNTTNFLLWLTPFLILIFGGIIIFKITRNRRNN
jgi:cytochrome c-type biogenesis protein CcmH